MVGNKKKGNVMFFYYHTTKDFFPDYKRKKSSYSVKVRSGYCYFPLLKEIYEEILKVFPVSNHGKRKQKKKKKSSCFTLELLWLLG